MRKLTQIASLLVAAAASVSMMTASPASAQDVMGGEENPPITMMGPDGVEYPAPGAIVEHSYDEQASPQARSWNNCVVYEDLWSADRYACFNINGSGTWADSQAVQFNASRSGSDPYTYVNVRYNVDRPNGQYFWGTGGGWFNILNGHTAWVPINNYIEAGNWCLRFQLQRTNGVWENWREVCGPVWA